MVLGPVLLAAALAGEPVADTSDAVEQPVEPARPPSLSGLHEAAVSLGSVFGDPWVRHHTIGLRLAHHPSDTFSVQIDGAWSPDFGQGDWKRATERLVNDQHVSPDFLKIRGHAAGTAHFTPVRGNLVGRRRVAGLGLYALAGFGAVWAQDPNQPVQCEGTDPCVLSPDQVHATMILGGGLRVAGRRTIARLELRDLAWVETLNGTGLETRHRRLAEISVGVVLGGPPAMRRRVPDEAFSPPPEPSSR